MNTREISNNHERYLSPTVFQEIFAEENRGTIKYFDKVKTGIGGTYSFNQIVPANGKINIIISANVGMILNKEKSNKDLRVNFICKDSQDYTTTENTRLVYITPESLRALWDSHFSKLDIDKVLVDEFHAIVIQSQIRKELRFYRSKLKSYFPNSIVVLMTATPLIYQEVDYRLVDFPMTAKTWLLNSNQVDVLKEIKENVKEGRISNIYSNNSRFFSNFIVNEGTKNNKHNVLRMNLNDTGNSMKQNIFAKCEVKDSDLLKGCSSKGFEGWDEMREGVHNYFIQDLNNQQELFGVETIYQTNRCRLESAKSVVCRTDMAYDLVDVKKLVEKVEALNPTAQDFTGKSITQKRFKVSNSEYYKLSMLYNVTHSNGKLELQFDDDLYLYYIGLNEYITEGFDNKKVIDYLKMRNVTVEAVNIVQKVSGGKRVNKASEKHYLESNSDLIIQSGMNNDDFRFEFKGCPTIDKVIKKAYHQLKRKSIIDSIAGEVGNRLLKAVKLHEDAEGNFDSKKVLDVLKSLEKTMHKSKESERRKHKNNKKKLAEIKKDTELSISKLIYIFYNNVNDIINFHRTESRGTTVMHRTFGSYVDTSLEVVAEIKSLFGITTTEIDINTCASRILYAINGLAIPEGFYGENKKFKKRINVLYNMIHNRPAKESRRNFKNVNLNPEAIEFAIDKFHNNNSNLFYLFYTEHEEKMLKQLVQEISEKVGYFEQVRRHDSILVFNGEGIASEINEVLKDFTYLGQKGWFDLIEEPEIDEALQEIFSLVTPIEAEEPEVKEVSIQADIFQFLEEIKEAEAVKVASVSDEVALMNMFDDIDEAYSKKPKSEYYRLLKRSNVQNSLNFKEELINN